MKKGFTLIELLAVIIILAVIALIATPIVLNVVDSAKESARQSSIAGYADAMKLGVSDYMFLNNGKLPIIDKAFQSKYQPKGENITCEGVYSTDKYGVVLNNCKVGAHTKLYCFAKGNHYTCDDATYTNMLDDVKNSVKPNISYKDNSGANQPILLTSMIPVKYNGTNWVYADTSQEWYDYDKKEWANAVVLKNGVNKMAGEIIAESDIALWYVWIPRYKYTIFNGNNEGVPVQEIEVTFESEISTTGTVTCVDTTNGTGTPSSSETCTDNANGSIVNGTSTYTHPAFTFGDKELTGIWVGKFENSGTTSKITIKPNITSLREVTVSSFFTAIQNMKTTYGIDNGDTHMMKSMEWGAVAYFKQSKYGLGVTDIGINNNSNYITGCGAVSGSSESTNCNAYNTVDGMLASTTGNIYGIYDMSGGTYEYVMGNMVNSNNTFYSSNAGFSSTPNSKYYTAYTYNSSSFTTHSRGRLGDATKETLVTHGNVRGGWYNNYALLIHSIHVWSVRGGNYNIGNDAGVFSFDNSDGNSYNNGGSRSILVAT